MTGRDSILTTETWQVIQVYSANRTKSKLSLSKKQETHSTSESFTTPHVREFGFRNPENCCLRNPESQALESRLQLKEFGIPLTITLAKNPEFSAWNPESTAWNPESKTVLDYLKWGEMTGSKCLAPQKLIAPGHFTPVT